MTWFVHYHALRLEYLCFLTTNWLSLRTDCSAHCVIKSCFFSALYMWNSCRIGEVVQSVGQGSSVCLL